MEVGDDIGVIRSPNFPLAYGPNTNCTWTLVGSQAGKYDCITPCPWKGDLLKMSDNKPIMIFWSDDQYKLGHAGELFGFFCASEK